LVEEHTNVVDDDEAEEEAIELEDLEQFEVPKVVSITKSKRHGNSIDFVHESAFTFQ
jgi:hypothetical protein